LLALHEFPALALGTFVGAEGVKLRSVHCPVVGSGVGACYATREVCSGV
jgi:hypothetical protein